MTTLIKKFIKDNKLDQNDKEYEYCLCKKCREESLYDLISYNLELRECRLSNSIKECDCIKCCINKNIPLQEFSTNKEIIDSSMDYIY